MNEEVPGLANTTTIKFEMKKEGITVAELGTEPADRARNIV